MIIESHSYLLFLFKYDSSKPCFVNRATLVLQSTKICFMTVNWFGPNPVTE